MRRRPTALLFEPRHKTFLKMILSVVLVRLIYPSLFMDWQNHRSDREVEPGETAVVTVGSIASRAPNTTTFSRTEVRAAAPGAVRTPTGRASPEPLGSHQKAHRARQGPLETAGVAEIVCREVKVLDDFTAHYNKAGFVN